MANLRWDDDAHHPPGKGRWDLDLGKDGTHTLEIPADRLALRCDGAEYSLGGMINRGPRVASFAIAGHTATMTLTIAKPTPGAYLRRTAREVGRRFPRTLFDVLAAALAGNASGARLEGSLAGYDAATAADVRWRIYELAVDGSSRGFQVARLVGVSGRLESWTHVSAGGSLPDGSNWLWPKLPK